MTNKKLSFSLSKIFRVENIFKNILIFFPILLSDRVANSTDITMLVYGFLLFTFMTSICYATNDFTDYKKDLLNKLKTKKTILKIKNVIVLNFFLLLFLIILFNFTNLVNFYLILYLVFFIFIISTLKVFMYLI